MENQNLCDEGETRRGRMEGVIKLTFPTDWTPLKTITKRTTHAPTRHPTIFQFIPPPSSMLSVVSRAVRYLDENLKEN